MGAIQDLATDLGADERTMRRAVCQGALRARRTRPRRLVLEAGERDYLRAHWELLTTLRHALRTERGVRLAVLYGSLARGDEDQDSDLDLLVSLRDQRPRVRTELAIRLERIVGRRVDIALLGRTEARAPLLLAQVLDHGRVLVDRDRQWPELRIRRRAIRARARRAYARQMAQTAQAIEELTQ